MRRTFVDGTRQERFEADGLVELDLLDEPLLAAIGAVYERIGVAHDDPRVGTHFTFFSRAVDRKREVSAAVAEIIEPVVRDVFDDHRVMYAMFITKWPGAHSGFGPHQDPWFVDESRFRSVNLWCPLVDCVSAAPDNGRLHVLPGSHRLAPGPRVHDASRFPFSDAPPGEVESYCVPLELPAGRAVAMDNGVVHYSGPNQTSQPRPVVSLGLVPREATTRFYCSVDGGIAGYDVSDSYFLDMDPLGMVTRGVDFGEPDIIVPAPPRDPRSFADRCTELGLPRRARMPAITVSPAFCFVCGSARDLVDTTPLRHESQVRLCGRCSPVTHDPVTEEPAVHRARRWPMRRFPRTQGR